MLVPRQDIYFTQADITLYTAAGPLAIIGSIFEDCRVGLQSYSHGMVIEPFCDCGRDGHDGEIRGAERIHTSTISRFP
jgi:hypothetical protein